MLQRGANRITSIYPIHTADAVAGRTPTRGVRTFCTTNRQANTRYREWYNNLGGYAFTNHAIGHPVDELFGESAIIEVKCPLNSGEHFRSLIMKGEKDINKKDWWHCQADMLFADKNICYCVSYDPRMKGKNRMKIIPVGVNVKAQVAIETKIFRSIEKKLELLKLLKP